MFARRLRDRTLTAFLEGGVGAVASASRAVQYASGLDVRASVAAARALRDGLNAAIGA